MTIIFCTSIKTLSAFKVSVCLYLQVFFFSRSIFINAYVDESHIPYAVIGTNAVNVLMTVIAVSDTLFMCSISWPHINPINAQDVDDWNVCVVRFLWWTSLVEEFFFLFRWLLWLLISSSCLSVSFSRSDIVTYSRSHSEFVQHGITHWALESAAWWQLFMTVILFHNYTAFPFSIEPNAEFGFVLIVK